MKYLKTQTVTLSFRNANNEFVQHYMTLHDALSLQRDIIACYPDAEVHPVDHYGRRMSDTALTWSDMNF